jgi:uridine phosphorylase
MQRIAESELIINKRGAIYHLNLRPEEIAQTIITVGDPHRVKLISKFFDSIEVQKEYREFVSHTGYLGKKRITIISTGIGTDNIDIVLNELDSLINIDFATRKIKLNPTSFTIIRVGTAGSLQQTVPVDSYVSATHGLGLDNLMNFYRFEQNEEEKQLLHSFTTQTQLHSQICAPYICSGSASLLKHFVKGFHSGITVTCPGFYGPQGRILRLGIKNPGLIDSLTNFTFGQHRILNFEMETSAIYGLSKLLGHKCISLSAIVANRVQKTFSRDADALITGLIKTTLETVINI